MHEAITVWRQKNIILHDTDSLHSLLLDILWNLLLNQQRASTRLRIGCIKVQLVLMTVHSIKNNTICIISCFDAWEISISSQRQIILTYSTITEIIWPGCHCRVLLSSLWILITIFTRICIVLIKCWESTLEELQSISPYFALIISYPTQCLTVCTPCQSIAKSKLLFVHPVRKTIDNLIKLTISCNLLHFRTIGNIDIILMNIGYPFTIRGERWNLLCTILR